MKAERLAHVLESMTRDVTPSEVLSRVDMFLSYIKARGFLSLLPRIVSEYRTLSSKSEKGGVTVTLSKEGDISSHLQKHNITTKVKTKIDPTIIGGYQIETDTTFIDASHKNALMTLYHSLTR